MIDLVDREKEERGRESEPHEWSFKYRAPQSHFKTCVDIFIHSSETHSAVHTQKSPVHLKSSRLFRCCYVTGWSSTC